MKFFFDRKSYHNYIKDNLFSKDNLWYWKWDKENVKNLHVRCSKCNKVLVYDESYYSSVVFFYCQYCNDEQIKVKGETFHQSQAILKREIQRRAKVGKFKQ